MKERPSWIRVIEGGRSEAQESQVQEGLHSALAKAIERTPVDWQSRIEHELLDLYRRHILMWNDEQLIHHLNHESLWEDATFARALIEVAKGKTTAVIAESSSL